jgi:hypothetical protein
MLLAAACFLCQAGQATPREMLVVKLSKPDTDHATFITDRNTCLTTANKEHWPGSADEGAWARHHLKIFGECMGGKGYKHDPNGERAIRYMQDEGRARIFVEAL